MAAKTDKKNTPPANTNKSKVVKADRRPADVMLAEYEAKRQKLIDATAAAVANYDRLIASAKQRLSPESTAVEVLSKYTPAQVEEMGRMFRKAQAALKGKTPEEIAALQAQAAELNLANAPAAEETAPAGEEG